jgi:hypothetical protein
VKAQRNPYVLEEEIEARKKAHLEANGWKYGMWRWFWVWRKSVHDAEFMCMRLEDALAAERALQSSADCYPEPKATDQHQVSGEGVK